MSFASLGLSEALVRAVADRGYDSPTPIQAKAIPAVLGGGDLLAGAQTGTGKTAGFVLPILQRLSTQPARHPSVQAAPAPGARPARAAARPIRALILTPTRELAAQVEESVVAYGKHTALTSTVVFGGVNINPQIDRLRRGVDILVATPGRLLDHVGQRTVDLSSVEILVLDEADRMLDMGFIPDIRRVLKLLPAQRQNLLFSATFSDEIRSLADTLLNKPVMIEVARRNAAAETVSQRVLPVDRGRKRELLSHMIREHNWFQVLVFTRTKHGANRLAEQLLKDGISSLAIHGNKSQGARTRALAEFKAGTLQVLVATDIAARGLDIVELPHVVNFDLPHVSEDYVHRIGRTGRAGAEGEAVSLVSPDENGLLRDIERLLRRQIPRETIAGFALDPNARNEPEIDDRPPRPTRRPSRGADNGSQGRRGNFSGAGSSHRAAESGFGHARQSPSAAKHGYGSSNGHGSSNGQGSASARAPASSPHGASVSTSGPRAPAPSRPTGVGGFRGRPSQRGR